MRRSASGIISHGKKTAVYWRGRRTNENCLPRPVNLSDQVKMYSFKNILQALKTANKPNLQYVHRTVQETQVAASQCHIDELLCR